MGRLRLVLIACLAVLASPSPVSIAQETFTERVEVNVVNVEVFVTEKDGRYVDDLTASDFTVLLDGEPVAISNFYTVAGHQRRVPEPAVLTAAAPASPPAAEVEAETEIEAPIPPEQRLHLLVFIDNFNMVPSNRAQVLDELHDFLRQRTAAGDLAMLVSYNRSLSVVQPFTSDVDLLDAGIEKIRVSDSNGLQERSREQLTARRMIAAISDPLIAGSVPAYFESYVDETRANLLHTTRAIESVVRSMAGVPGRKALLYVSDGLPLRPGHRLNEYLGLDFPGSSFERRMRTKDENELFDSIIHQANAHQVTFYTLDARGADQSLTTVSAVYTGATAGYEQRAQRDGIASQNLQAPLISMADGTGGTSFVNSAGFDTAMDTMAKDFEAYYSLGFQSLSPGDGKYHRIEVRVNRPGVKVRHRTGFLDKPGVEQVADKTLASLILGMDHNPLGIFLQFEPPKKQRGKRYLLPTLVHIPFRDLTLLPKGPNHVGQLRIFVAVQDEEGGVSPLQDIPFPVVIPTAKLEAARQRAAGFLTQLEMRPGQQVIAVGVFDELSGAESFVRVTVPVGEKGKPKRRG